MLTHIPLYSCNIVNIQDAELQHNIHVNQTELILQENMPE